MLPPMVVSPSFAQPLGLARLAQADVLVPVELEGRREVVDLGHATCPRAQPGFFVGGRRDRILEGQVGHRNAVAAESVAKFGISITVLRVGSASRWRRPTILTGSVVCLRANSMLESTTAGRAVAGGADLEEPQRVGHHRARPAPAPSVKAFW